MEKIWTFKNNASRSELILIRNEDGTYQMGVDEEGIDSRDYFPAMVDVERRNLLDLYRALGEELGES